MRVTHVLVCADDSGAPRRLQHLVERLGPHHGVQHCVITLSCPSTGSRLGRSAPQLINLDDPHLQSPRKTLRRLSQSIRKSAPTLVQGWDQGSLLAALAAPRGVPVIWGLHYALDAFSAFRWRTRLGVLGGAALARMRSASLIFASRKGLEQHTRLGYPSLHALHIPDGVAVEDFPRPGEGAPTLREQFGIPSHARVLGNAARFHPVKNHRGLIDAFAQVLACGRFSDLYLVLVGTGISTKNSDLMGWVEKAGVADRVYLLDCWEDLRSWYAMLDGYVCASHSEAQSMALTEAMASGRIPITTRVGDAAEMAGPSAETCPPRDTRALAAAIQRWAMLPEDTVRERGAQAADRIRRLYSVERLVSAYAAVYQKVAAQCSVETKIL